MGRPSESTNSPINRFSVFYTKLVAVVFLPFTLTFPNFLVVSAILPHPQGLFIGKGRDLLAKDHASWRTSPIFLLQWRWEVVLGVEGFLVLKFSMCVMHGSPLHSDVLSSGLTVPASLF